MAFSTFVTSVTSDRMAPKVIDNILAGNVLCMRLLANGKPWQGGAVYRIPIKYQSSTSGGSYSGFDVFSTTQVNTRVLTSFDPTQNYFSVVISGIQQAVNSGDAKVLDLLETEMSSVADDMADSIGTQLYSDGSGNVNKDIIGLDAAIDDGNTTASWAGLNGNTTYTTWVSTLTSNAGAITLANLRSAYDSAKIGNDAPTLIVTTPAIWTTYEGLLQATINYHTQVQGYPRMTRFGINRTPGNGQVGDVGFDTLFFRGIPVVADEKCTAGRVYLINEKHLWWAYLNHPKYPSKGNQYGFAFTGLKEPTNQDASVGLKKELADLKSSLINLGTSVYTKILVSLKRVLYNGIYDNPQQAKNKISWKKVLCYAVAETEQEERITFSFA